MFTMSKIRDGRTYLSDHLTANDYYCENESITGRWVGRGAAQLGLQANIRAGDPAFEALRQNRLPDGSGKLTPRYSENRIRFFDFQCSAQKSVSIMAVTFGDARLLAAHDAAAARAFRELEKFAARQANTAFTRADIRTGSVVAASFRHTASRALDPQVHTHFVTANGTWDSKAKGWRALNEFQMVKAVRYAGKVYQNEMARSCRTLGYEIIETRDRKRLITGFEIAGVSPSICKRFSKRRAEVEKGIAQFVEDRGREPTPTEVHAIAVKTRDAKLKEITTSEVLAAQRIQLKPDERAALETLRSEAKSRSVSRAEEPALGRERESLQFAVAQLYERQSVAAGHEVLAEALNQHLGHIDLRQLEKHAQKSDLIGLTENPWLHERFATKRGLEAEQWSVGFVDRTRDKYAPLGTAKPNLSAHLSPEQKSTAMEILASRDQVICFRGAAGVGKTTVLSELWKDVSATGTPMLACAPTSSAVDTLRKDGLPATTLTDLLQNIAHREPHRLSKAVIVVDEAGLASSNQGAQLLRLAERHSARVLFVGDTRQHSSVEAGDFLRVLETHSSIHRVELTLIRRQQPLAYRDAVVSLAAGDTRRGLEKLDALGWIKESPSQYYENAVSDFLKLRGKGCDQPDVLAVTPTWLAHYGFTQDLRRELMKRGELQNGRPFTAWVSLQWTRSMTADARRYERGMVACFHRSVDGFAAAEAVTVSDLRDGHVWVGPGRDRRLPIEKPGFTVVRTETIQVAAGDSLLIRANDKASGLINGERIKVAAVEENRISFTDGRRLDTRSFGHFCHGYAVTSYAAQGQTVDHVIVVTRQLDAKEAYVACSRARLSCTIHTHNKAELMERINEGSRPSALDLLKDRRAALNSLTPDRTRGWTRLRELVKGLQPSTVHPVFRQAAHFGDALGRVWRTPLGRSMNAPNLDRALSSQDRGLCR